MTLCQIFACGAEVQEIEGSDFCHKCREEFSAKALELMSSFQTGISQILVNAAKLFHTAQGISDYLGISLPTLYSWVTKYHNLSFRQFKRKYICSSVATCIVVDHGATDYGWKYTISDRVHATGACMCFVEGSSSLFMCTLTAQTTEDVLKTELALEHSTGIHHLRYPIRRLPIFQPPNVRPVIPQLEEVNCLPIFTPPSYFPIALYEAELVA